MAYQYSLDPDSVLKELIYIVEVINLSYLMCLLPACVKEKEQAQYCFPHECVLAAAEIQCSHKLLEIKDEVKT